MSKKLLVMAVAGCLSLNLASPVFALGFGDRFMPNDTMFSNQWALHNTGQRIRLAKGTEDIDMDIPEAWQYIAENIDEAKREDVIVAVLDSGVNYDHNDLSDNILKENGKIKGYDFVAEDEDPEDNNGHGTMIAGIIAAKKDNLRGIAGISDRAKIMPVKVLDDTGSGSMENLKKGILYAADNGADVINMSLVGSFDVSVNEAIKYAYSKGAIIVSASGSDNSEIGTNVLKTPIDNEQDGNYVLGVSAITNTEGRFANSNYGSSIDVSAPGESIVTAYYRTNMSYVYASGTSLAAANVSGVAALLKSCFPERTNSDIILAISKSAQPFVSSLEKMGSGIVNAYNSLLYLAGNSSPLVPSEPDHMLIRLKDNPTIFYIKNDIRRGIPRIEVFEAWGFSFNDVETVDSLSEIECYIEGKLLGFPKGNVIKGSTPTVFEIQDNDIVKGFSTPDAFLAKGHKWEDIFTVTDYEILNSYAFGEPIVQ